MLRGAKKNMIVVRTRDSRMFEEAYFVMRRNAEPTQVDDLDMMWEANRILESALPRICREPKEEIQPHRKGTGLRNLLWFSMGSLCGGGIIGLLWLLL